MISDEGKKELHRKMHQKKPPLGTGERFSQLKAELAKKKGVTNPGALAAAIGRKKYGRARFSRMSHHQD